MHIGPADGRLAPLAGGECSMVAPGIGRSSFGALGWRVYREIPV